MPTSIRLSPDVESRLDALVRRTGRTKAFYVRELVERGLEDVEDYYLAVDAMDRVRRGEEEVLTSEEMWRDRED